MKRKAVMSAFILTIALMLSGCNSGTDSKLVGAWVDLEEKNGLIFYEDGTFSEGDDEGTFYTKGNQLILEAEGHTIHFDYKLADSILTLTREDGEVLMLKKYLQ